MSREHGGPTLAVRQMLAAMNATDILLDVAATDDGDPEAIAGHDVFYFRKVGSFYKFAPRFVFWFWKHARNYDVVHIHALFSFLSTVAGVISWLRGVPYILRPLGTLAAYGVLQRRPRLKRVSMTMIEGPLLRRAAAVHFTSDTEMQEAQQLDYRFRSVVIPLAAKSNPENAGEMCIRAYTPDRLDPAKILYLSRLDPKKNLEGLLHAFVQVNKRVAGAQLVIAGSGDATYVASLVRLSEELGISSSVSWAGFVSGAAKVNLFNDAALYVLPSFSENFGIAVAEALAAGLPCIVSTGVALAPDIVEYAAGRAVAPTAEALAAAIIDLVQDSTALKIASHNAVRLASERFAMTVMRDHLIDLYNTVSARRNGC
jgi:glycosyltransferase involved in cell wall biosynthesis